MSIYQSVLDFNQVFAQLTRPPVIVNDLVGTSEEEREQIKKKISTYYEGDTMSTVPTCSCGETTGEYNTGVQCPECLTVCEPPTSATLESTLWMRSPNGVADLINPVMWYMINEHFKVSGFRLAQWIADAGYKPKVRTPKEFRVLEAANLQRGYNYFVQNFDAIMTVLFSIKTIAKSKSKNHAELIELITLNRHKVFSKYLPLPNRSILIIEGSTTSKWVDMLVVAAIDAIQTITSIDAFPDAQQIPAYNFQTDIPTVMPRVVDNLTQRGKENRTIKAINNLSVFQKKYYGDAVAAKKGLYRKQIYGTRAHFSARAVISSITNRHKYDEIYIPWPVAMGLLRIHIMNKLSKRGYTTIEAISKLNSSVQRYDEVIDTIFNELIAESPYGGLPCILQRNPSLERGSAQLVRITKIKNTMNDPTISMSILIVKGLSADFDGDALNLTMCVDNFMAEELYELAPHKSTFDLDKPYNVSTNLSMPKTVISTFSSWLAEVTDPSQFDPAKVARTDELLEARRG